MAVIVGSVRNETLKHRHKSPVYTYNSALSKDDWH